MAWRYLSAYANELKAGERKARAEAFTQAGAAIHRAGRVGGVPADNRYPWGKSYPQPARKDGRRVDVEVWAGRAFVPDEVVNGAETP